VVVSRATTFWMSGRQAGLGDVRQMVVDHAGGLWNGPTRAGARPSACATLAACEQLEHAEVCPNVGIAGEPTYSGNPEPELHR
jgi:hypothetical protein